MGEQNAAPKAPLTQRQRDLALMRQAIDIDRLKADVEKLRAELQQLAEYVNGWLRPGGN